MRILAFLLGFYLFATSSALAYLSLRSWLYYAAHGTPRALWRQSHWLHACRSAGFACVTVAALISAVSDNGQGVHLIDIVSITRMGGYVLLLASTPRRLRRRPLVSLAFALLLLGEAVLLLNASGSLPHSFAPINGVRPMMLVSMAAMDIGMWLLWRWLTRTVLRVRLTDKFTLAFSIFSVLLMMLVTLSVAAVIQLSLRDLVGIDPAIVQMAYQNLDRPLIVLFVAIVASSAIVSFFLARNLIEPVNQMGGALRRIGKGDLNYRLRGVHSRDEMQDLAHELNRMAQRLKEADALRAEFVSFASHELRNPLTAVKGFIETLDIMDTPEGAGVSQEERAEIYGIIKEECERLLRMTNELLDNSRVEAGRPVVMHVRTFDVRSPSSKVLEIMRTHTKKHRLFLTAPEQPVPIEGDVDKFEQILINLLSNAIKYSPDGGLVELIVDDKETSVDISVRDEGMGMTPEQAEHVFDKFYRIQDVTNGVGKAGSLPVLGTGIGLYLTRALVNAHGGTIRVQSAPEHGSIFTVTLPKTHHVLVSQPAPTQIENNGVTARATDGFIPASPSL
ncbi:MAG: multi-sensor signal transduction histidine kinase [Capsulimonas sp.]|nr:multi-sensor signal transduction histidine kinase [Capsulimonas sp.]